MDDAYQRPDWLKTIYACWIQELVELHFNTVRKNFKSSIIRYTGNERYTMNSDDTVLNIFILDPSSISTNKSVSCELDYVYTI